MTDSRVKFTIFHNDNTVERTWKERSYGLPYMMNTIDHPWGVDSLVQLPAGGRFEMEAV